MVTGHGSFQMRRQGAGCSKQQWRLRSSGDWKLINYASRGFCMLHGFIVNSFIRQFCLVQCAVTQTKPATRRFLAHVQLFVSCRMTVHQLLRCVLSAKHHPMWVVSPQFSVHQSLLLTAARCQHHTWILSCVYVLITSFSRLQLTLTNGLSKSSFLFKPRWLNSRRC